MFTCGICNTPSIPREKAVRVVTETREATYAFRPDAHAFKDEEGHKVTKDDPGGRGVEIVREILCCPRCVADTKGDN